ncbi:efflux transporter periplasmic adaptor subunit [filamentous cyanobacterium CCP5]|nr:efflux transporter periplasmic adaptor subunit [filamentous cyanobacterium CCP5]
MELPLFGKIRRPGLAIALTLVAVVVAAATAGLIWRSRRPQYDLSALTVPVETQALTVRVTASGTVQPIQTVNLSPKNAGIVVNLLVEQGDAVSAGEVIARMSSDDIQAQIAQDRSAVAEAQARLQEVRNGSRPEEVAQAEAALRAATTQVEDAQARLDLAQSQLRRTEDLYQQGALPASDLDSAQRELRSAQAAYRQSQAGVEEARSRLQDIRTLPVPEAVAQAEAQVAQAQGRLQGSQVRLEDTIIRAPFDGIVTQKFATEGAFVTPTTSASEATSATSTAIVALARGLEVLVEVPEADISQIQPGQRVEIRADAFPDQMFQGQVRLIAPEAIERQNVTLFQVRVELLSGEEQLRSNMNVTVSFIGNQLEDAMVVPTVAVVTQGGTTGVLVPGDRNDIVFRPVELGPQVGDQIQVLSGVTEGQPVLIDLPPGKSLDNIVLEQAPN